MQTLQSMVRARSALFVLALLLVLALRPAAGLGAADGGSFQVHYAAHDFYVVGPDYAASTVRSKTGVQVAPLGGFQFQATDDDISLRIDDEGPLRMLPVHVSSRSARGRWHCLPNHGTTAFGGFRAGETIFVQINAPTHVMCDVGGATIGIATITR